MRYQALAALPQDHILRNRPLGAVGAQYMEDGSWRKLEPSYAVFSFTYNQLGSGWLSAEWRVPEE